MLRNWRHTGCGSVPGGAREWAVRQAAPCRRQTAAKRCYAKLGGDVPFGRLNGPGAKLVPYYP